MPEPVQMTSTESGVIMDHVETLAALGIEVEKISSSTLVISAYPAMLSNLSPADLLRQVAAKLSDPSSPLQRRDLIDELLHMIACKAAIKAGDPLTGGGDCGAVAQAILSSRRSSLSPWSANHAGFFPGRTGSAFQADLNHVTFAHTNSQYSSNTTRFVPLRLTLV